MEFLRRRREFITLVGGAAVTWPLAARAQQREKLRRIGMLMPFAENDPESSRRVAALRHGLQQPVFRPTLGDRGSTFVSCR